MWNMAAGGFSQISIGNRAASPSCPARSPQRLAAGAPKDVAGQATLATAGLAAALEELQASAHDIVMMRVYVVNATTEAFQQVLSALRGLLGDAKPSMTTIGVQALYTPEILVEIEMAVRSLTKWECRSHNLRWACRKQKRVCLVDQEFKRLLPLSTRSRIAMKNGLSTHKPTFAALAPLLETRH